MSLERYHFDGLKDDTKYSKVSFFVECIKKQLITLQNFNIQTCFGQFLWFFILNVDLNVRYYLEFT